MQKYTEINENTAIEDSRELLLENDKTAISNNAGTAFPTENLFVGMKCYRMDEAKTYTLKSINPADWILTEDLNRDIANADKLGGVTAAMYAKLASPKLSGTPTTPNAAEGTNTEQIANCAFVLSSIARLVATAPSTLDTLQELATALGNDPNFATTITNMIAGKESVFAKNSAFNKNFGNVAGTVCQGNDARLSDARPANGGTSAACSGNAATATYANNSNTLAGLTIHNGRNSEANKIVRTNGNGYIDVQYINTNVGVENGNVANIFYDNGDGYIRKCSKQHLINSINGAIPGGRMWIE